LRQPGARLPGHQAAPTCSYLEAHGFRLDRFIADPLRIEEGYAIAPDRPGHGVEFDWKARAGA
jgi:L-alanine-DL-glutamate epimerase-like enolase superfamily enzyme